MPSRRIASWLHPIGHFCRTACSAMSKIIHIKWWRFVAASSSKQISNSFSRYWPWFFFAAAFESLVAVAALLLVPSESGLSPARLALLGILAFMVLAGIFLGMRARHDSTRFDSLAGTPLLVS